MKNQIFKRSRKVWQEEIIALADIVKKQELQHRTFEAKHTETQFVWELQPLAKNGKLSYQIAKKEVKDLKEATEKAIKYFDTFEGNLKGDHTETNFVFSKVR
jgi:hypothetical protein